MVIPRLVRQALTDDPLTVHGDGTQQRCFCHVRDVVVALADLMVREDVFGEVYNIGSAEETTILDLASLIRDATGSKSEIKLIPYNEAYEEGFEDMLRRIPDISKIRDAIGWTPEKNLGEIIADVIETVRASAGTVVETG
jgi:UDP-glucose 4-epimerase